MIRNASRDAVLAVDVSWARSARERTRGLLDRDSLEEGEALVISPCSSIHMFGMRFPIDAIFVNRDDTVIAAISRLKPWRFTRIYFTARHVIELPAGVIEDTGTQTGDRIEWTAPE